MGFVCEQKTKANDFTTRGNKKIHHSFWINKTFGAMHNMDFVYKDKTSIKCE